MTWVSGDTLALGGTIVYMYKGHIGRWKGSRDWLGRLYRLKEAGR
jgi:hypothetical protein